MPTNPIDVLVSFDTTGSMYPCLTQVRRKVQDLTKTLFREVPDLRMSIIAHGDYCDGKDAITTLDFSTKPTDICKFVQTVKSTGGGDTPECYEAVLRHARSLDWQSDRARAFVMIGDATPHPVGYYYGGKRYEIDWQNELKILHTDLKVRMYSVQCLRRRSYSEANRFWEGLADCSDGYHLELDQFATMPDLLAAIAFQQLSNERLEQFEQQLVDQGRMTRNIDEIFGILLRRTPKKRTGSAAATPARKSRYGKRSKFAAVDPARFQVMDVDDDCDIKRFVEDNGLRFQKGRGFYEFTKSVLVQENKEVVLRDRASGDMFTGEKAREMIGLPFGERGRVNPRHSTLGGYTAFIQSTSWNRKLLGGTQFLYEVEDYAA